MTRTTTIYTVIADVPHPKPTRWTGMTDKVFRFSNQADARAFAAGKVHFGAPATVTREEVPAHIAQKWGL